MKKTGFSFKNQKFLRLWTFVFFFHFSGLNNGYSVHFVATAHPSQSVALFSPAIHSLSDSIHSGARLLRSTQHWITAKTLKLQTLLTANFENRSLRVLERAAERSLAGVSVASFGLLEGDPSRYWNRRESWTEDKKDLIKPNEFLDPAMARELIPAVERALINPISPWIQAHRTILKMACQRNLGGDSDGDGAPLSSRKNQDPSPALGIFVYGGLER